MSRLARVSTRKLRVLDFDVECRPTAWYGGDFVTKQPTVIAWKFVGERARTQSTVVGESGWAENVLSEERAMIEAFREAYDAADVVTGHFIRGFDLPLLSGALVRLGGLPLAPKLTQDTKNDLVKISGVSKSQESLGAMFELAHPKIVMNTGKWARANMLLPDGIALARERCVGDVEQHIEMRAKMLERNLLRAPSWWSSEGHGGSGSYHA